MQQSDDQNQFKIIQDLIHEAESKIQSCEYAMLLLGNTGCGKTTLGHFLNGHKLIGAYDVQTNNLIIELMNPADCQDRLIGHQIMQSETICPNAFQVPQIYNQINTQQKAITIQDCPGFSDAMGVHQEIVNAFLIDKLISKTKFVKFVLVISDSDLNSMRGQPFLNSLDNFVRTLENHRLYEKTASLVITHVDDEKKTVMDYKNTLRIIYHQQFIYQKAKQFPKWPQMMEVLKLFIYAQPGEANDRIFLFKIPKGNRVPIDQPIFLANIENVTDYIKTQDIKSSIAISEQGATLANNYFDDTQENLINDINDLQNRVYQRYKNIPPRMNQDQIIEFDQKQIIQQVRQSNFMRINANTEDKEILDQYLTHYKVLFDLHQCEMFLKIIEQIKNKDLSTQDFDELIDDIFSILTYLQKNKQHEFKQQIIFNIHQLKFFTRLLPEKRIDYARIISNIVLHKQNLEKAYHTGILEMEIDPSYQTNKLSYYQELICKIQNHKNGRPSDEDYANNLNSAFYRKGQCLMDQKSYDEAVQSFLIALMIKPFENRDEILEFLRLIFKLDINIDPQKSALDQLQGEKVCILEDMYTKSDECLFQSLGKDGFCFVLTHRLNKSKEDNIFLWFSGQVETDNSQYFNKIKFLKTLCNLRLSLNLAVDADSDQQNYGYELQIEKLYQALYPDLSPLHKQNLQDQLGSIQERIKILHYLNTKLAISKAIELKQKIQNFLIQARSAVDHCLAQEIMHLNLPESAQPSFNQYYLDAIHYLKMLPKNKKAAQILSNAYYCLGLIHENGPNSNLSLDNLALSVKVNPGNIRAHEVMARIYVKNNMIDKALKIFMLLKHFSQVEVMFNILIDKQPTKKMEIKERLCKYYTDEGFLEEAIKGYKELMSMCRESDADPKYKGVEVIQGFCQKLAYLRSHEYTDIIQKKFLNQGNGTVEVLPHSKFEGLTDESEDFIIELDQE